MAATIKSVTGAGKYGTDLSSMYNYSTVFEFEKSFQFSEWQPFMQRYWTVSFLFVAAYLSLIVIGRRFMKTRAKFELRLPLVLWNLALGLFSISGAIRTIPEIVNSLLRNGYHYTACHPSFLRHPVSGFWTLLFVLSKVPELGDTAFVVLRKQPLIFLHWFHHATVLLWAWYSFTFAEASGRWNETLNYTVHAIMYSYYFLKALRLRVPKVISLAITSAQLLQMCLGFAVNVYVMRALANDPDSCAVQHGNNRVSFSMYAIYMALFAWFFYNSYLRKNKVASSVERSSNGSHYDHDVKQKNGKSH